MSGYVFALCAPGAERTLKEEVERRRLGWAPSYQRGGFVTFKREGGELPELVFARERSESLGRLEPPWEEARIRALTGPGVLLRASARVPELAEAAHGLVAGARAPELGESVGELVVVSADELWVGRHVHDATHSIHAGGLWPFEPPPEAPSRAYLKIEAVLEWTQLRPLAGELAVEMGSAPGGTSWALLERGMEVIGVDPNTMDPRVLAHPRFRWIEASIRRLDRARLPARADWLLGDMNIAPKLTLENAERLARELAPRVVILTLKLEKWELARKLPAWIERVRAWGYGEVRARQLAPHGQELVLAAWNAPSR